MKGQIYGWMNKRTILCLQSIYVRCVCFFGQVWFPPQAQPSLLHSSPNSLAGPRISALIVALWPRPSLAGVNVGSQTRANVTFEPITNCFSVILKFAKLWSCDLIWPWLSPKGQQPTPTLLPNSLSGPTISALIVALGPWPSLAGVKAGSQKRAKWAQKIITNCLGCHLRIRKLVLLGTFLLSRTAHANSITIYLHHNSIGFHLNLKGTVPCTGHLLAPAEGTLFW